MKQSPGRQQLTVERLTEKVKTVSDPVEANLDQEMGGLLFEAWLQRISREQLGLEGGQVNFDGITRTVICGNPGGTHFSVTHSASLMDISSLAGVTEWDARRVIEAALVKVVTRDFGNIIVYQTVFSIDEFDFSSPMHLMRTLGDQRHIEGSGRLSGMALLDFQKTLPAEAPTELILLPTSEVTVTLFVDGPAESTLTSSLAAGLTEVVAAICAFATGRPVKYNPPLFALEADEAQVALTRRADVSLPTLARDSVSLDIFTDLGNLGGADAQFKARGFLLAYHAALNQTSPDVAVMLLVTSLEALIAPRQPWGKNRVTPRFIHAVIELCPDAVDALIDHQNVGRAFGYVKRGGTSRQRRDILERVYEARSIPTHTGLSLAGSGFFDMASSGYMRVALLSELARAALLAYLQAPRSFILGNPVLAQRNESLADDSAPCGNTTQ